MVYAIKKFRHYLLANKFVFYTDHQALLYLVNKPCNTGHIVQWFIILLEFDFTTIVKKGVTHQRTDHLLRLTSGEKVTGVDDDLRDTYLFNVEMVPSWSKDFVQFMTLGKVQLLGSLEGSLTHIEKKRDYAMLTGRLYKKGVDGIQHLCIEPKDADMYMQRAHVAIGNIHFARHLSIVPLRYLRIDFIASQYFFPGLDMNLL